MLVIARKVGQTVLIGDNIEVTISAIRGDQVRLAINAPREITILRSEVAGHAHNNAAAPPTEAAPPSSSCSGSPEGE